MKRVLDYDALTGRTIYHEYDSLTDTTTLHTQMDVEPIVEHCKAMATMDDPHERRKSEFWYAGEIPLILVEKWLREEGIDVFSADPDMKKKVRKKLRLHGDYHHLRTGQFQI